MTDIIVLSVLAVSAAGALLCGKADKAAMAIGTCGCIAALLLKLLTLWQTPMLVGCFQLPIALAGIAAVIHSAKYLGGHAGRRMSIYYFLFNITIMAMLAVTMLGKGIAFLAAWELMGLASFGLVAFDWKKSSVRQASWIYLLSCEAGGLLLVWLLAMDLGSYQLPGGVILAVTLIAFGIKAGFPLLHVWLPEAHPAAPAPMSAVMSSAMIPLGFYGMLVWVPDFMISVSVGWVFLVLGIIGMLGGILFGSVQPDLKRLLAYSSVENIGIITLALALGILGGTAGMPLMAALALTGAFLHIINHALLKGTLFLGAGSVYKSLHTLNMDEMGGVGKKMPWTSVIFSCSAMGISGLPPFCGFTGELLIYLAAFQGIAGGSGMLFAASTAAAVALALTGGLAAAAFAKAVSAVFSGEPRSDLAVNAANEQESMVMAQLVTGMWALAMTWAAPWLAAGPLAAALEIDPKFVPMIFVPLFYNSIFAAALLLLIAVLAIVRRKLLARNNREGLTWDCGYARPTARMQYTATAFIQPIADLFEEILKPRKTVVRPEGLFPTEAFFDTEVPDSGSRWFWNPVFRAASYVSERVKHLQSGYLHIYILIMVAAILLMLGWSFVNTASGVEKSVETVEVSYE